MPGSFSEWAAIATIASAGAAILKDLLPRKRSIDQPRTARTKASNLFAVSYIFLITIGVGLLFYLNSTSELLKTISSLGAEISYLETNISSSDEIIIGQKQDILAYQDTIKTRKAQAHELLRMYKDTGQTLKLVKDSLSMHLALVVTLEKKLKNQESEHTRKLRELEEQINYLENSTFNVLLVASDATEQCVVELKEKLVAWGFKVEYAERATDDEDRVTFYVPSDSHSNLKIIDLRGRHFVRKL